MAENMLLIIYILMIWISYEVMTMFSFDDSSLLSCCMSIKVC